MAGRAARPLGISDIGVANRYAGRGVMPRGYEPRSRRLTRFRALRAPGGSLERDVYDDISRRVNELVTVNLDFTTLAPQSGKSRT